MTDFITPYLPADARLVIKDWQSHGKPAFHRVLERRTFTLPDGTEFFCQNCGGAGSLFVSLCEKNNYDSNPSQHQRSIYFEGGPGVYAGWYKVDRTLTYTCPHCKGSGRTRTSPISKKQAVVPSALAGGEVR